MPEFDAGTEIAGYRIESVIGRGGMAVVYRAEDTRLGRKVALKLLTPALAENEQFQQRFIRESRLAASLDHPNIVPIYEAGEAEGRLFIAMRYVPGGDLKALIAQEGGLPPARILRLFVQIGDALDAAHVLGLVHRDVKPGNILVTSVVEHSSHAHPDHVYLTDFGLTKRTSSLSGSLTGTGHFLGTVDYVSPEQIQGAPVGPSTDMYSLGCLLYECLTGQLPFHRDDDAAVLWAHLVTSPPPIAVARPDLPPEVNDVVARAMAKDPEDRYDSCHELVRDLEYALNVSIEAADPTLAPSRQVAKHGSPLGDPGLTTQQPSSAPHAVPGGGGTPGPAPEGDRQWVSHPSLPPGAIQSPPWRPSSSPVDGDEDVGPPELPENEDDFDDLDSEFDTDADEPEWDDAELAAPMAARNRGGRSRRLPILITAAIVATLAIVGVAVLFQSRTAQALRPYNSTDTLVRFSLSYPQSWTASKGVASDIVFSPQPQAAGATFFQGSADQWGRTSQLLRASPEQAVGAYTFAEFSGTDTTTMDGLQQAISALTPPRLLFQATHRQFNVGGAPAQELEGVLEDPSSPSTRLHVMFDLVQPPSGGSLLLTFFAAPDQFGTQLPLFTTIRDSVRFLN
jgi:serine/threonine protein kinase